MIQAGMFRGRSPRPRATEDQADEPITTRRAGIRWETLARHEWLFSAAAGAAFFAVVWPLANVTSIENGAGFLQRWGFPLASFPVCVGSGALLGAAHGLLGQRRDGPRNA